MMKTGEISKEIEKIAKMQVAQMYFTLKCVVCKSMGNDISSTGGLCESSRMCYYFPKMAMFYKF